MYIHSLSTVSLRLSSCRVTSHVRPSPLSSSLFRDSRHLWTKGRNLRLFYRLFILFVSAISDRKISASPLISWSNLWHSTVPFPRFPGPSTLNGLFQNSEIANGICLPGFWLPTESAFLGLWLPTESASLDFDLLFTQILLTNYPGNWDLDKKVIFRVNFAESRRNGRDKIQGKCRHNCKHGDVFIISANVIFVRWFSSCGTF